MYVNASKLDHFLELCQRICTQDEACVLLATMPEKDEEKQDPRCDGA